MPVLSAAEGRGEPEGCPLKIPSSLSARSSEGSPTKPEGQPPRSANPNPSAGAIPARMMIAALPKQNVARDAVVFTRSKG